LARGARMIDFHGENSQIYAAQFKLKTVTAAQLY
jgi:hypothetical protein